MRLAAVMLGLLSEAMIRIGAKPVRSIDVGDMGTL